MTEKRIQILMILTSVIFFSEALQIVSGKVLWLRYFEYIVVLVLACFACKDVPKSKIKYLWVVLTTLAFFLARGLLLRNNLKQLGMDIIVFSSLLLLFAIRDNKEIKALLTAYLKHICIWICVGLFVALYLILKFGFTSAFGDSRFYAMDDMLFERQFGIGAIGIMLQPAVFISPLYFRMTNNQKGIWLIGILSYIIAALWTSTRETFIVGILSILIAFYSISGKSKMKFVMTSVTMAISLLGLWSYYSGSGAITEAAFLMSTRFEGLISITDQGRLLEADALLNQFAPSEWMIGRGLGGTQNVWIWFQSEAGIGSMHFGWAHLMLKGGLVLLTIVYGGMLWCLIVLWTKKGWYRFLALYLCLFLIQDMWMHNQWINFTRTITLMLLTGIAFTNQTIQSDDCITEDI